MFTKSSERSADVIVFKIAEAFLRQRYPLSKRGMRFRSKVEANVASGKIPVGLARALPTVENPRPELFLDLNLPDDSIDRVIELFGCDLQAVQTTEGCSHGCSKCFLDAKGKVEVMPFAAVVKIERIVRAVNDLMFSSYYYWRLVLDKKQILRKCFRIENCLDLFEGQELLDLLDILFSEWCKFKGSNSFRLLPPPPGGGFVSDSELKAIFTKMVPLNLFEMRSVLTNYIDSDPLDYVDWDFLHLDGTPADYGDVFQLLTDRMRPIHISTAGWRSGNVIAERAVAKVVETYKEHPSKLHNFRISVSPFECLARKDWRAYLTNIQNMIVLVAPLKPIITVYHDNDDEGNRVARNAISQLKRFCKRSGTEVTGIREFPISNFSGRAGNDLNDYDPMDDTGGYFICPNGEVKSKPLLAWQKLPRKKGKPSQWEYGSPKGSRPELTGERLYELNDT